MNSNDLGRRQERWQLRAAKEQQEATLRRMEDVVLEKRCIANTITDLELDLDLPSQGA